jgi:hypothetical protein
VDVLVENSEPAADRLRCWMRTAVCFFGVSQVPLPPRVLPPASPFVAYRRPAQYLRAAAAMRARLREQVRTSALPRRGE